MTESKGCYDFIVIGAGAAGSVLADRLSAVRSQRVLVLEAGARRVPLTSKVPITFSTLFKSRYDWAYSTEPELALCGRRLFIPRGKLVGGSSAMNAMVYIRGNPQDYDGWEAGGASGWSFQDVLPYFLRTEDQARGPSEYHASGGPLRVEDLRSPNPLSLAFVDACSQIGIPRNEDFNGQSQLGTGLYQVTQKAGRRWSAADAYLFPAMERPNLQLVTGALVRRVVLDGRKAVAVEYECAGRLFVARAEQEVVLAAGTIGSPQILMLSGIGPADHLRELGIEVRHCLPGVGTNLQDHPFVGVAYECLQPVSLRNALGPKSILEYLFRCRGPMTSNVAEAGAFVCSGTEVQLPDLQFHFAPAFFVNHGFESPKGHGFSIGPVLVAPKSRGRVRLRSADPRVQPRIFAEQLRDPAEVRALLAGLRLSRSIAHAPAFRPYRGREERPGAPVDSEPALLAYIRETAELLYHPVGSCKMGSGADCVVDSRLRVHDIERLRIADASVMPVITRGNTNAPTLMIAERASDWIVGRPDG